MPEPFQSNVCDYHRIWFGKPAGSCSPTGLSDPILVECLPANPAGTTRYGGEQVTVTESKQAALLRPVPPVCPSSQRVMDVPVAVMVPLNGTHVLLVVVWAGFRLTAVDQLVDLLIGIGFGTGAL